MRRIRAVASTPICRRQFMCACGCAAAGLALGRRGVGGAARAAEGVGIPVGPAVVRGAFLYPSTESLKKAGYYSWPGSTFNAEGRQKEHTVKIEAIAAKLGMKIVTDQDPLHEPATVEKFINEVKASKPDGLLLIPFYKADWVHVCRIVKEAGVPTVILATIGVLLSGHINQLNRTPGVYLISALEDFEAVEYGMRMIRTIRRMKQSCLISLGAAAPGESIVEGIGTRVRRLPHSRLGDLVKQTELKGDAKDLAADYRKKARKVVEPTDADIDDAARTTIAMKKLIAEEKADAIMMDCLGGIQKRLFPPPCMGYMDLRDAGIPAGCQNELDPALTLMLVENLFGKGGFQQNPAFDTERNLYCGSHCTSPSRLEGPKSSPQPYILRSHAEAGVGAVPEVIWPEGMDVTMAYYTSGQKPRMIVYSGKIVGRLDTPPAGGCRTNLVMTINELRDVTEMKGAHQIIFAGNHARQLRAFCQLMGITVTI